MLKRILSLFRKSTDPRDAIFARRAQRLNNRSREAAALAYAQASQALHGDFGRTA